MQSLDWDQNSIISRDVSLITDHSNTNRLQTIPKTISFKSLYDHFALYKIFRIICERKHEHFSQKIDNQLIAKPRNKINGK